jgi:uncharacterized protein (DUF2141 family)
MRFLAFLSGCVAAAALGGAAQAAVVGGTPGAACAPDEAGPALKVTVAGIKDRRGILRLELYPDNDKDFLGDDYVLLKEGKVFRRVEVETPSADEAELCIRVPEPGRYSVAVLHDRHGGHKFDPFVDGAGFANNPKLGYSKPKAASAAINIGPGVTPVTIVMNYWNGLSFGPHHHRR